MRNYLLIVLVLSFNVACSQTENYEEEIAAAVMAAPEEVRENATVYVFTKEGELKLAREGSNEMICIGDDPTKDGFDVACYQKDLHPFMTRGRELKAKGMDRGEIFKIRAKEVKEGKLKMPESAATLHVLSGPNGKYDPATGTVTGAKYRYVVYMPFATAESTGLPLRPMVPGGPWIMDPGTHRAHIMISPPGDN